MATGTSIFLIAVGAILTFAIDAEVEGVDLSTVGVILMVVGAIGVLISLLWLDKLTARRGEHRVVEERTTREV